MQVIVPVLGAFGVVGSLYVISYVALVRGGKTLRMADVGGPEILETWWIFPEYHGVPPVVFEPIHALDRDVVRPGKWAGSTSTLNPLWMVHVPAQPKRK